MTSITAATTAILAAIVLAGCSPATKTASTGTATPEITVDASDSSDRVRLSGTASPVDYPAVAGLIVVAPNGL